MPLKPGESLLHFRLVDKVGEGGMGEVWKALDTTLDREVAVKVLPAAFAGNPERVARFEREAKLLASLNHPNIAAIYGFPEAAVPSGVGETVRFLAMEMVRGEDLAQILARGPLPALEALDAARQIASALEAAHDSGVIHRDLKPANIKRTPEGQIKVLDFGLAKALEAAPSDASRLATVTSAGSVAGAILGTVSYMSPEQARGQAVDRRTDLWAFGCVLYEMLSGAKAFDGATVTDVLAAVVTGEPDWEKLPASTPTAARRLLRRCLEKDPRKRLRDAGDASLLLDENPEDARRGAAVPSRPARIPVLAAIAIATAVLGGALGWWAGHRGAAPAAAPEVVFKRLSYGRGMVRAARFAPDGQTIVYGAAWDGPPVKLYLARVDSPDATPISIPPAEILSISRTGEMAVSLGHAYTGWMADGTLARTALLGGSPREILEHVRAADFSPDGSQFAIVRRVGGFDQLEYPAGTVLYKTPGYVADMRISPDGDRIAFADHPVYADDRGDLAVIDRAGRKTTLQAGFPAIRGVAWAPGGKEIWFTAARDESTRVLAACDLRGQARTVHSSAAQIELFDIAETGRVLLGTERPERQVQALLAGFGEARNVIVSGEASLSRAIAPDGKSLLVSNQLPNEYETYLVRADRPGAVRLSSGDAMGISPDGTRALAVSADSKSLLVSPLGAGQTRPIPNPEGVRCDSFAAWLPDGKRIVFTGRHESGESRAYVCDVATGALKTFGAAGLYWNLFVLPPVSPDGKFVVLRDTSGAFSRWPVDGGAPLPIAGLQSGEIPLVWSDDGSALYVGGDTVPIPISRLDLVTGRRTLQRTITPSDAAGLRFAAIAMSPNGKYWTLSTSKLFTDLYVADGLR